MSDPDAMRRLFERAESAFGGVDVLVNNAGIMELSSIAQADDTSFDRQIASNLKGVFNGMREAARRLRAGGRIISFSSSVVGLYQPTYGVYAATKAAVEALTHVLANEMRGRNITVNAVAPGPTGTDLFLTGKPPEMVERIAKLAPLERLGQPPDIAGVVSFLAEAPTVRGSTVKSFARTAGSSESEPPTRQRPVIRSRCSGYRAPCTVIFEAALSISRRSSGVSSTAAAPMFSSRRCSFVVPGIGTIHGFWASSQASAI